MSLTDVLLHLGYGPPVDLSIPCPPAASGQTTNPTGYFDFPTVKAAFDTAGITSLALVILIVGLCYMATRVTMGPRFRARFFISLGTACVGCAVAAFAVLHWYPTTAMANSCQSNPTAFAWPLPMNVILMRSAVGMIWGIAAFLFFAWLLTYSFGRLPAEGNGFFHNRGWPWPRALRVR